MTASERNLIGGKYEVLRELGSGGSATVFLAQELAGELGSDRLVAIKVLRDDGAFSDARQRFSQEIRVMASLRHPHIVPMFDTGTWNGRPYLVMPYIEGETMATRLFRHGPLEPKQVVRLAIQLCEALDYAHARHLVHRDVKPSNIIFDSSGNIWLADFGVARWTELTGDDRPTRSSAGAPGTFAYASPEQLAGARNLDGRSDIYSIGVVLFEALTGELPFGAASGLDAMKRRLEGSVPSLRSLRREVSQPLSEAVTRCLRPDPAQRWESAAKARDAFVAADAPGFGYRTHALFARPARALVGGGLMVAVIILGLAIKGEIVGTDETSLVPRIGVATFKRQQIKMADGVEDKLRDALLGWQGLAVVESSAGLPVADAADVVSLTRRLQADLLITGEVESSSSGHRITARLWQSKPERRVLRSASQDLFSLDGSSDAALENLVEQLLIPGPARGVGLRSYGAAQAFAEGMSAVERWDLAKADRTLSEALAQDAGLGAAALWLAQVRIWQERPLPEWSYLVSRAQQNPGRLRPREQAYLQPLLLQQSSDYARACPQWLELSRMRSREYEAWLNLALCLRSDRLVVETARGARFRASYQTALEAYRKALEMVPASHAHLGNRSFERVRRFMLTSATATTGGKDAVGRSYLGFPALSDDSVYLMPVSSEALLSGQPDLLPKTHLHAIARLRSMFDSLTASWTAAYPSSSDAQLARAVAHEMQNDERMFSSVAAARASAVTASQSLQAGSAQLRMLIKRGVLDVGQMQEARRLGDSLLKRFLHDSTVDRRLVVNVALLTGRIDDADRLLRQSNPRAIDRDGALLLMYSALQGPVDSIKTLLARLEAGMRTLPPEARMTLINESISLASTLSFPAVSSSIMENMSYNGDYLVDAQRAVTRGDKARAMALLRGVVDRRQVPPAEWSLDAACAESRTAAAAGNEATGKQWITSVLNELPAAPPSLFADDVSAGVFIPCLRTAAALAETVGDHGGANRFTAAARALWGRGSP